MNIQLNPSFPKFFCAIAGPTASGKSGMALDMAQKIGCDILSVDSMQIYRGLDVGTAKPTLADQASVRHHGIDLAPPTERFSAERYSILVEPVLQQAMEQNRRLILCGGTGLYYRALLEGFVQTPDPDETLRRDLYQQIEEKGNPYLYQELQRLDSETACGIHPNDTKRIVRVMEIVIQTGKPLADLKKEQRCKPWIQHTLFIGLRRDRKQLYERIERRTDWMYENGLVEETRWMLEQGCTARHPAMQALGYRECARLIEERWSLEAAVEATKLKTRRFAKRQMTWFRHQFPIQWLDCEPQKTAKEFAEEGLQIWQKHVNVL